MKKALCVLKGLLHTLVAMIFFISFLSFCIGMCSEGNPKATATLVFSGLTGAIVSGCILRFVFNDFIEPED